MLDVDEAAISDVRDVIAELTEKWKAVPVGGLLKLGFARALVQPGPAIARTS